jgi:hypothetical protein
MPNHTCTIHTTCDSHAVLHRLEDIATSLPSEYQGANIPFHGASPLRGDLFVDRILPDGERVPGKIPQTSDRTLEGEVVAPALDTAENIRELVGGLVDAYLSRYPAASDHISQQYKP